MGWIGKGLVCSNFFLTEVKFLGCMWLFVFKCLWIKFCVFSFSSFDFFLDYLTLACRPAKSVCLLLEKIGKWLGCCTYRESPCLSPLILSFHIFVFLSVYHSRCCLDSHTYCYLDNVDDRMGAYMLQHFLFRAEFFHQTQLTH